MPRYYFHLRSSNGREIDEEGLEFATLAEAIADARKAHGEMLADETISGVEADTTQVFEIVDTDGQLLATVPFTTDR